MDTTLKKTIKVGIANKGETNILIETLLKWKPEKINYHGDLVFFSFDGVFFSIDRKDFKDIFES
jgi:hypothetical protein